LRIGERKRIAEDMIRRICAEEGVREEELPKNKEILP